MFSTWEPSFDFDEHALAEWALSRGWTVATPCSDLRVEAYRPASTDTQPYRKEVIAWERTTTGAWRIERHGFERG